MALIKGDFLKKYEVCAMSFGRKGRPACKKAGNQMSKADEWLVHLSRKGDTVMVARRYISTIRLFPSPLLCNQERGEVGILSLLQRGNRLS